MKHLLKSLIAIVVALGLGSTTSHGIADDLLTVGSRAPEIDIEHWVQNGDGKFQPIKEFEAGKIYVIEFWATWCGPCRASMPHISKLQDDFASRGVTVISVSDEELETVTGFLEEEFDDQKTFADVTRNYCLTTDPDGSVHKDYMEAAQQGGIPTAFIVGKKGEIEWIGHPAEMDDPLSQVVDGKWDREAFAAQLKEEQQLREKMMKVGELLQENETGKAIDYIDEVIAESKNKTVIAQLEGLKLRLLLQSGDKRAVEPFNKMVGERKADANGLNEMAWMIVELSQSGVDVDKDLIAAATKAAEMGVTIEPKNGAILDTLAHLLDLQGELDRAIEVQRKALENPGEFEEQIKDFLKELEAKKKG